MKTTTRRGALLLIQQATLLPDCLREIVASAERGSAEASRERLRDLLCRSRGVWHVHAGAEVALVGPPNAGKSLLSNRLGRRAGSLVADQAGTTRDWVTLPTAFAGVPIRLIDTAGVRAFAESLEYAAIQAGAARAGAADLTILVLDATSPACGDSLRTWLADRSDIGLVAWNKCDLPGACLSPDLIGDRPGRIEGVRTSALTGEGVPDLRSAAVRHLCGGDPSDSSNALIFIASLWAALAELADKKELRGIGLARGIRQACWREIASGGETSAQGAV